MNIEKKRILNGNLQIPDVRQIREHSQSKIRKVAWNYFPETDKNVSNGIIYDQLILWEVCITKKLQL